MNDKEKLDLIENYVRILLNNRIELQLRKGRFGMSLHRFNKEDCAHLEGEIDALSKVLEVIKNRLRDCPSADVRENKHGEWISHTYYGVTTYITDKDVECSECGHRQPRLFDMNYCPNCGEEMRGRKESND